MKPREKMLMTIRHGITDEPKLKSLVTTVLFLITQKL
jgi:hypothetical protein